MTAYLTGSLAIEPVIEHEAFPDTSPGRRESDAVLQAVGELLDARTVDLVALQEKDRATEAIAGWSRDGQPSCFRTDSLAAAVMEEAGLARPGHRAQNGEVADAATFAIDLARRQTTIFFLVIQFDRRAQRRDCVPQVLGLVKILRRSFALETRLLDAERKKAAALAALDQDKCGVIAVTVDGCPVIMNSTAAEMLSRGDVVQLSHDVVRPTHYPDVIRFHAALDSVAHRTDGGGRPQRDAVIMLLNGNRAAAPLVVSIAPFAAPQHGGSDDAVATIHLFRPVAAGSGLGAVCQLFGLSPMETKLGGHLYRGKTIAEAASAMQIKIETARSYLKQIFAKTDTHRQADLLALLYQYSSVVRGNHDYAAF